jgi:long-chain acyl-CoA synthetase
MNGSVLLSQINFRHIYFRGKIYDRKLITDAIDHLAKYLTSHMNSSSPFILLSAYNHIKTLIAYYAILKAGKIVAILDPESRSLELTEIIEDLEPSAILFLNSTTVGFDYDEEVIFRKQTKSFIIKSDLNDVCTVAYTNAEDGYPKAAMLTEKNILAEIYALVKTNKLDKNSVTCALLPFSHLYGLMQGILVPTNSGGISLISEINILKVNEILDEIKKRQITHLYTVPSLYYILGKVPGIRDYIGSVKEFYSGGTKLSGFIYDNFFLKTNHKIREGYGLTEGSPGVSLNFEEEGPNIDSIGKALPGCEIRIFNNDDTECNPDKIGEICIKGDMVFKGYFNNMKTSAAVLKNGWLHTGDYGKKDKEGFVYFTGLKKNMINVAGNNVYPHKIERLMKKNTNVSTIEIFSEDSIIQGQTVRARINLRNHSLKEQESFKKWCFNKINNVLLPKVWLFEE